MPDWVHGYLSAPIQVQPGTILNLALRFPEFTGVEVTAVKKISLCLLAVLLCAGTARPQDPDEPPPNPEMIRQELINLEKENARAIKLHNSTFFKSVYSEDFTGVTRYGEVLNKTGVIREVLSMPQEFDSVVSSDPQVRMFRDTASVLSMRSEVGRLNGKKFYNQYRILRMYVNTSRGWKVVSQLETMLSGDDRH
jgi:hypothetical protein